MLPLKYRVVMRDGSKYICFALSADEARAVAFSAALKVSRGRVLTYREQRAAFTPCHVEELGYAL